MPLLVQGSMLLPDPDHNILEGMRVAVQGLGFRVQFRVEVLGFGVGRDGLGLLNGTQTLPCLPQFQHCPQ